MKPKPPYVVKLDPMIHRLVLESYAQFANDPKAPEICRVAERELRK